MGDKGQISNRVSRDYIFYVSELEDTPLKGHFRKMDAGIEIVKHIRKYMPNSKVMKFTEYSGELLDADSIGIVFPAHTWGLSLAVRTFLTSLRFRRGTYVYAVAVGETLAGDVDCTVYDRVKLLEQFEKVFSERSLGCQSDIFVRCTDRKRMHESTEERLRGEKDKVQTIKHVLSGLLFHTLDSISTMEKLDEDDRYYEEVRTTRSNIIPIEVYSQSRSRKISLSNIYLDEDIFRGVKLCQVM